MPKIQQIVSEVAAAGMPGGRQATGADFGAGIGEGIASVGKGLFDYGQAVAESDRKVREKLEAKAQQDADFEADKQIALATTKFVTRLKQYEENPPAGGVGLTDQFVSEFEDYRTKLAEGTTNERASKRMFLGMERIKSGLLSDVIRLQSGLAKQAMRTEAEGIINQAVNNVRVSPALYQGIQDSVFSMIDAQPIGEDNRNKWKATVRTEIADALVDGNIDQLQRWGAARFEINSYRDELLRDKGLKANMSPQAFNAAISRLDQLGKQTSALDIQRVNGLLADAREAAKDGRMTAIPEAAFSVYGDDAVAKDRLEIYNQSQRLAAAISGLSTKTQPEMQRVLSEFEPKQTGEGYIERKQDFQTMVQAASQLIKQRDDDPAAYANRYDQKVSAAFQAYNNAPNAATKHVTAQRYAEEVIAFKQRMGIATTGILPLQVAQGIVDKFSTEQGSEQSVATLNGLKYEWGKYYPQVYGQIAKDLPNTPLVIGSGMREGPAMRLSGLTKQKMDEISEGIAPTVKTDMSNYLGTAFERARMSLQATNPASGRKTFVSFFREAEKLAMSYISQDGLSPKDAAEKAYVDTFGDRYKFIKSGSTYLRVPKGQDITRVENGISAFRKLELDKLNVVPFGSLAGLDEKQRKTATMDIIKDQGYWVTSEDEKGAYLFAPAEDENGLFIGGAPVLQEVNGIKSKIFRSWDALELFGVNALPTLMRDGLGKNK